MYSCKNLKICLQETLAAPAAGKIPVCIVRVLTSRFFSLHKIRSAYLPDLAAKEARLTFQRAHADFFLIHDVFDSFLCCMHELQMYSLKLTCAPDMFAALLAPGLTDQVFKALTEQLLREWQLVVSMESEKASSDLLALLCPYTRFQPYRDLCSCLEIFMTNHTPDTKASLLDMVAAYFPKFAYSSNVEQLFSHVQDSVNRSQKPDLGSMSNIMAVALRAVDQRLSPKSDLEHIQLLAEDWDGKATRALKHRMWTPSSARPSF